MANPPTPWWTHPQTPASLLNRLTELRMVALPPQIRLPPAQPMELQAAAPMLLRPQPVVTTLLAP